MPEAAPLHPVNRSHLDVLTDAVGIMQHAVGDRPDPGHGYCTDDVARALEVDLLHARDIGWDAVAASGARNVRFLEDAFNPERGRFRNFRLTNGTWLEDEGSEDCRGRALLGLGWWSRHGQMSHFDQQPIEATALLLAAEAAPAATGSHLSGSMRTRAQSRR